MKNQKLLNENSNVNMFYHFSIIKIKDFENIEKNISITKKYVLTKYKNEKTQGYIFINGAAIDYNNNNVIIL